MNWWHHLSNGDGLDEGIAEAGATVHTTRVTSIDWGPGRQLTVELTLDTSSDLPPIDQPWFVVTVRFTIAGSIEVVGIPEGPVEFTLQPDLPAALHVSGDRFDLRATVTSIDPIRWDRLTRRTY